MAKEKIYQGEDYLKSFSRTVEGVVTTHAEIAEIEVVLLIDDAELIKFSKTDRTASGWERLTQEMEEGKYTLTVPKANTAGWRAGKIVEAEFTFVLSTDTHRRFKVELGEVKNMYT